MKLYCAFRVQGETGPTARRKDVLIEADSVEQCWRKARPIVAALFQVHESRTEEIGSYAADVPARDSQQP